MKASHYFTDIVGIIGGVGPEATSYFTALLTKARGPVKKDQEHIPYLLFNNPQIPDRSHYLLYQGTSPIPELIHSGTLLKNAGATFLVIPCNTAHSFIEEVAQGVGLPVIDMIDATAAYLYKTYGNNTKFGLLASSGTIYSKVYQTTFARYFTNSPILVPDEASQKKVMKACYDIKKFSVDQYNIQLLNDAAQELIHSGAQVIILGCTEIPLALTKEICHFQTLDPMEIMAQAVIEKTLHSAKRIKATSEIHCKAAL